MVPRIPSKWLQRAGCGPSSRLSLFCSVSRSPCIHFLPALCSHTPWATTGTSWHSGRVSVIYLLVLRLQGGTWLPVCVLSLTLTPRVI